MLAWFAGQDELVSAFANDEDVYKHMASAIYGVAVSEITKEQRFVGKTTILGAGYGMGAVKFQAQISNFGVDMELDEARRVINIYRETNWKINQLWRECQNMIRYMANGDTYQVGPKDVLQVIGAERAIQLPSNLLLKYHDLRGEQGEKGIEYNYKTRIGRTRIYGGKVVENLCQAIARCIIGEQMLEIDKKYQIVLTVHDSIVICVRDEEVPEAQRYIEECMRQTPRWAKGLPIDCESGIGKSYGECE